jgi:hypothetical protein
LAYLGCGALALTVTSAVADRRRMRRRDIEAVGFMPWPLITVCGTIATLFAFALSIKSP